jgi:Kelch motif
MFRIKAKTMSLPLLPLLLLVLLPAVAMAKMELAHSELSVHIPKRLSDHTATLGSDHRIYIAGGCDSHEGSIFVDGELEGFFYCPSISNSFYAFDPVAQTFETLPDLPRARYRHAAVAIQDHIFFAGGRDIKDDVIDYVDVFDVKTYAWASLRLPLGFATSDLASFGTPSHAFFAGGYDQDYNASDSVYSLELSRFAELGEVEIVNHHPLLQGRGDISATIHQGYAYVSGGFSHENDFCEPLNTVERYSLEDNTWALVAPLPTARADKAMVTYQGHVLSLGGERQVKNKCELLLNGDHHFTPTELTVAVDAVEVLQDDDAEWEELDPLPAHRFRFAAVVFDNIIYTFGGQKDYEEDCNCLKTTDRIVTFIDNSPDTKDEEDADQESEPAKVAAGADMDDDDIAAEESATAKDSRGISLKVIIFCPFVLLLCNLVFLEIREVRERKRWQYSEGRGA